jgi:hypothetical protein
MVIGLLLVALALWPAWPVLANDAAGSDPVREYLATADVYLMEQDTPYFVGLIPEVTEAVNGWLDAIAARDVEGVLAFVLPEDVEFMRAALSDSNDVMYRTFLADDSHIYKLAGSGRRDLVLIRTGTRLNPGPGIDACIFDRGRTDPQTDQERLDIFRHPENGRVCEYFFHGDGHWRFGYSSVSEGGPEDYEPPGEGQ